ncbi:hypothetical protein [Microscilla marina]|uniref:hypothetical protein n=1 Tax=Microscilla marina TaxID=1027 RepID=UPI0005D4822D|nr:hypothetical protein [Microscilla marina]
MNTYLHQNIRIPNKTLCLLLLLGVLSPTLWAQGNLDREIEVVKNRKIVLPKANKHHDKINLPPPTKKDSTQQYINFHDFLNPAFSAKRHLPLVKPAGVFAEDNQASTLSSRMLEGYIKAGGGNFATSYAEGAVSYRPNSTALYGISLRHHQSRNGAVRDDLSATAQNDVQVQARYFANTFAMRLKANYQLSQYHFYGYDLGQSVEKDTVRQLFQRFGLTFRQVSTDVKNRFQYDWGVKVNYLKDAFAANETLGDLFGKLLYRLDSHSTVNVHTNIHLGQRTDAEQVSRFVYQLKPFYGYSKGNWRLEGGVNMVFENDTLGQQNNLHFYPHVLAEYALLPNLLLNASLKGDIQRTSLNSFTTQNPFVNANVNLAHTNQRFEALLGVNGTLYQKIFYKLQVGYEQFQNLYFFVNSATDTARFDLMYQTDNINRLKLEAQLGYEPNAAYKFYINGVVYNYQLPDAMEAPWHRPLFQAELAGVWVPTPKWRLNLNFYGLGGIQAKNFATNEVTSLGFIADMNLKVDYVFWEKGSNGLPNLSAFVALNNIFAKNYQRYLYYPRQGFNFLIGLMYGF